MGKEKGGKREWRESNQYSQLSELWGRLCNTAPDVNSTVSNVSELPGE